MKSLRARIQYVKDNPKCRLSQILSFIYRIIGRNKVKVNGKDNILLLRNTYMRKSKIVIHGSGNVIDLGQAANFLDKCSIYMEILNSAESDTFSFEPSV